MKSLDKYHPLHYNVKMTKTMSYKNGIPYSPLFDDIYFSETSVEESQHVFIEGNRLPTRFAECQKDFVIGELGFGTGLNFTSTFNLWREIGCPHWLRYISIEAYPLDKEELTSIYLNNPHFSKLKTTADLWIDKYMIPSTPSDGTVVTIDFIEEKISLTLLLGPASKMIHHISPTITPVDAWYLDGFSPQKNPDLWSASLLKEIHTKTAPNGTFATYSVAKMVRDHLTEAGFTYRKQAGVGPKRHILVGEISEASLCS